MQPPLDVDLSFFGVDLSFFEFLSFEREGDRVGDGDREGEKEGNREGEGGELVRGGGSRGKGTEWEMETKRERKREIERRIE